MVTIKNNLIFKDFKLNIGIFYNDIYDITNKDISYWKFDKLSKEIIENVIVRSQFLEYIFLNKTYLKKLVWNKIVEQAKKKSGRIIEAYVQVFYTRLFEYCDNLEDFESTLCMTPDVEVVLEEFLKMIFIPAGEIEKLYMELLYELQEEKNIFEKDEFEEIFKRELIENMKKL